MIFELNNLSFSFEAETEANGDAHELLKNISGTVHRGQITAILGRSGVGKSTLLYLLGLLFETELKERAIQFYPQANGEPEDYAKLTTARQADLRRKHFGFAMQSSFMLPQLNCLENVALPLAMQGVDDEEQEKRVEAIVEEVDSLHTLESADAAGNDQPKKNADQRRLRDCLKLEPRMLSGGERRRMSLLRGLIHDPDVLYCDEPVSNLDHRTSDAVMRLLVAWQSGGLAKKLKMENDDKPRTLVLVTHDVVSAARHAHNFLVFQDDGRAAHGKVVSAGDSLLPASAEERAKQLSAWMNTSPE